MSQNYDFQVAQADAAAMEAGEAQLENAKLRALRSEAAWRQMADRTLRMEEDREKARIAREQRHAASPVVTEDLALTCQ